MNESKKLTIRVSFKPQHNSIAKDDMAYHYHWGRVIGGSLAVLISIGSIIYGSIYYFGQDNLAYKKTKDPASQIAVATTKNTPPTASVAAVTSTKNIPPTASVAEVNAKSTLPTATAASKNTPSTTSVTEVNAKSTLPTATAASKNIPPIASVKEVNASLTKIATATIPVILPEELIEAESSVTPLEINEETAEEQATLQISLEENTTPVELVANNATEINPIETPPAVDLTLTTAVNTETVAPLVSENKNVMPSDFKKDMEEVADDTSTIENIEPTSLFTQSKTDVFSDHIKRFIISPSVKANEPFGTINDIIFDNNNIATVYAFSEVSNLKNTTLYYLWSLNGEDVAKVKVNIEGDRWRSYSSKFIQPTMHGEWKVELQNENAEILAINRFYY